MPLKLCIFLAAAAVVQGQSSDCPYECSLEVVESIPLGMSYQPNQPAMRSTADAWKELINSANETLDIASLYWTLRGDDVVPDETAAEGEEILELLKSKARILRIATSATTPPDGNPITLEQLGARVRSVNMTQLVGAGVLHTKLILADNKSFYLGSANMDWRSLTQVKELGILGTNCPCLANDLQKIFSVYWIAGASEKLPYSWPLVLGTKYNYNNRAKINLDGSASEAVISSSPPQFSTLGRTNDIDAIVNTIHEAEQFINIAVMDYFPMFLYSSRMKFWPAIDNELRRAYINRGVNVNLLVSKWQHTRSSMLPYLKSLVSLNRLRSNATIAVKWFKVPSVPKYDHIPFARVNHNKYMVTEKAALIGTSNWSADYFTNTGGISLIIYQETTGAGINILKNVTAIFKRDWDSSFAENVY